LGFTSTYVAAASRNGTHALHQMFGRFSEFAREGLQFRAVGFAQLANNQTYTVESGDAKEAVSVTKDTISFGANDDIYEGVDYALAPFDSGDVIQVSGSVAGGGVNNGTHLVKTPSSTHIEISPDYHGAPGGTLNLVNEAAGLDINIVRGNSVIVTGATTPAVVNEHAGASVTITAHGEMIAQSFVTGTSGTWTAAQVEIQVRKVGNPTDAVYVQLRANGAGVPGALLDSAFVDDADIPQSETGEWITFDLANTASLVPGTTYWLQVFRSGINDSWDFYELGIDEGGGYAGGTLKLFDGLEYQTPTSPKSLLFRVLGAVDTATQVQSIADSMGVFTGVTVQAPSGIATNQYRDGTQYASDEAAALLETGTDASKRLLATVGAQRNVTIRPVPDASEAMYVWKGADALSTLQGSVETRGLLPVGSWCHLDDQILLQGALAAASPFLVEYARYDTGSEAWELRPAGAPDPWAVAEIPNG
jgi:hypothetical protein